MKPNDDFFSGNRYAIFGVKSPGRAFGGILISALKKSGKTAIAIEPDNSIVKNAETYPKLTEAGSIDGVILLPPSPWNLDSADFTKSALLECKASGVTNIWIYTDGNSAQAEAIAEKEDIDVIAGRCPCLNLVGCGFPHNFHRWILKVQKQL